MIYHKSTIERIADFFGRIGFGEEAEAKRIAKFNLDRQFYQNGHSAAPHNPVAAQQL